MITEEISEKLCEVKDIYIYIFEMQDKSKKRRRRS